MGMHAPPGCTSLRYGVRAALVRRLGYGVHAALVRRLGYGVLAALVRRIPGMHAFPPMGMLHILGMTASQACA